MSAGKNAYFSHTDLEVYLGTGGVRDSFNGHLPANQKSSVQSQVMVVCAGKCHVFQ